MVVCPAMWVQVIILYFSIGRRVLFARSNGCSSGLINKRRGGSNCDSSPSFFKRKAAPEKSESCTCIPVRGDYARDISWGCCPLLSFSPISFIFSSISFILPSFSFLLSSFSFLLPFLFHLFFSRFFISFFFFFRFFIPSSFVSFFFSFFVNFPFLF